jgi:bacterioferritin
MVGQNVDAILKLLNQAYASEWLAYYQYWLGAKLIKGPMKDSVAAELTVHATEELAHAALIANRIIQLGGTPVLTPEGWAKESPCKYAAPPILMLPFCSTKTLKVNSALSQLTKD